MKLSKLHIDQFRHLENLDFDFTYPADFHDESKRGKALDKICFIGQSATGKTGLLELIREESFFGIKKPNTINFLSFYIKDILYNSNEISIAEFAKNLNESFIKLIYFPSELNINSLIKIFEKNYATIFNDKNKKSQIEKNIEKFLTQKDIVIDGNIEVLWDYILFDLQDYSERLKQLGNMISTETNPENISKILENWKNENPNPYTELAEVCLNPILKRLNLELSSALEKNKLISIKSLTTSDAVGTNGFSTGTKQLLLTALPLYKLDTKEAIILIDEPERSLYPDMQMDLMEYYQNLAPEAQFIVATHSPFIAAAFEPEERFILYFDENGKVAVRRGTSPIGDDPNDMLYNDFGIDYINKFGKEVHKEYLDLKQKIFFEKDESEKQKIAEKLEKIGDQYNF